VSRPDVFAAEPSGRGDEMIEYGAPEACRILLELLESRDYWVLPFVSMRAASLAMDIEERFYKDAGARDRHRCFGLWFSNPFGIAFYHKQLMTPAELNMLIDERKQGEWRDIEGEEPGADVVMVPCCDKPAHAEFALVVTDSLFTFIRANARA
jgi:hypothetical protein